LLYSARILSTSAMKLSAWLSVRGGGRGYMPKMGVLGSKLGWLVKAGAGLGFRCGGIAASVGSAGLAVPRCAGGGWGFSYTHARAKLPAATCLGRGYHVRDHFHVQLEHRSCEQSSSDRNSGMLASCSQQWTTGGA
jgi:hypothetical protein